MDSNLLLVNYYWLRRDYNALALHYHLARTYGKGELEKFLECHCSYCREDRGMHSVGLEGALDVVVTSIQTSVAFNGTRGTN